ncbi:MAG: PilZ domain-containing protein [Deltaproteobacteria bacterium]
MTEDRRSETRQVAKNCYSAEIRLVGVPVHEVKLIDLSSKGASILFKDNSSLFDHLQIGKDLTVKYFFEDRSKPSKMFQAKVKHITEVKEGRFKGYYLAGLSIL